MVILVLFRTLTLSFCSSSNLLPITIFFHTLLTHVPTSQPPAHTNSQHFHTQTGPFSSLKAMGRLGPHFLGHLSPKGPLKLPQFFGIFQDLFFFPQFPKNFSFPGFLSFGPRGFFFFQFSFQFPNSYSNTISFATPFANIPVFLGLATTTISWVCGSKGCATSNGAGNSQVQGGFGIFPPEGFPRFSFGPREAPRFFMFICFRGCPSPRIFAQCFFAFAFRNRLFFSLCLLGRRFPFWGNHFFVFPRLSVSSNSFLHFFRPSGLVHSNLWSTLFSGGHSNPSPFCGGVVHSFCHLQPGLAFPSLTLAIQHFSHRSICAPIVPVHLLHSFCRVRSFRAPPFFLAGFSSRLRTHSRSFDSVSPGPQFMGGPFQFVPFNVASPFLAAAIPLSDPFGLVLGTQVSLFPFRGSLRISLSRCVVWCAPVSFPALRGRPVSLPECGFSPTFTRGSHSGWATWPPSFCAPPGPILFSSRLWAAHLSGAHPLACNAGYPRGPPASVSPRPPF